MITLLMIFFGIAILQAGIRLMAGQEMTLISFGACALGAVLVVRAILRLLLWIAPKSASEPQERSSAHTPTRADAPSES